MNFASQEDLRNCDCRGGSIAVPNRLSSFAKTDSQSTAANKAGYEPQSTPAAYGAGASTRPFDAGGAPTSPHEGRDMPWLSHRIFRSAEPGIISAVAIYERGKERAFSANRVSPREGWDVYSSRPLSLPALFGGAELNVKGIIPGSFRPSEQRTGHRRLGCYKHPTPRGVKPEALLKRNTGRYFSNEV